MHSHASRHGDAFRPVGHLWGTVWPIMWTRSLLVDDVMYNWNHPYHRKTNQLNTKNFHVSMPLTCFCQITHYMYKPNHYFKFEWRRIEWIHLWDKQLKDAISVSQHIYDHQEQNDLRNTSSFYCVNTSSIWSVTQWSVRNKMAWSPKNANKMWPCHLSKREDEHTWSSVHFLSMAEHVVGQ